MLNRGPTATVRALSMVVSSFLKQNPGVHSSIAIAKAVGRTRGELSRTLGYLRSRGSVASAGKGPGSGFKWIGDSDADPV